MFLLHSLLSFHLLLVFIFNLNIDSKSNKKRKKKCRSHTFITVDNLLCSLMCGFKINSIQISFDCFFRHFIVFEMFRTKTFKNVSKKVRKAFFGYKHFTFLDQIFRSNTQVHCTYVPFDFMIVIYRRIYFCTSPDLFSERFSHAMWNRNDVC